MKKAGYNIHDLKHDLGRGKVNIFKDKKGNLYVLLKSGKGEPYPLDINIRSIKK